MDPIDTVYSQLVVLLKGEPTLCGAGAGTAIIRPGNFISFEKPPPYPQKTNKTHADFPELTLDQGNYTDSGYATGPTFATFASGGPQAWLERFTQVYTIDLILRDYQISPSTQLRAAIGLALRKSGPRLGLPNLVKSWGPMTSTTGKGANDQTGGTLRRFLKIQIPVNFWFNGQDIPT
jgi:hypothetical protein